MYFHCVRYALRCHNTADTSVGFPRISLTSSLDSCCLSTRWDTSDVRAFSSQHRLRWFGDLVMDALALILPIWRPASSAKTLVYSILLFSPGISRYCYLWFGQSVLFTRELSGDVGPWARSGQGPARIVQSASGSEACQQSILEVAHPDKGSAERITKKKKKLSTNQGFLSRQLTCPFLVPGFPHSPLPGQAPEPRPRANDMKRLRC